MGDNVQGTIFSPDSGAVIVLRRRCELGTPRVVTLALDSC